jgi:hypothetical protein
LLNNILLTPFDQEMRHKGYQLTTHADDWVLTCVSAAEARVAVAAAPLPLRGSIRLERIHRAGFIAVGIAMKCFSASTASQLFHSPPPQFPPPTATDPAAGFAVR